MNSPTKQLNRLPLCLIVLGLFLAPLSAAQAQGLKVGVFDPQRVSEMTGLGKRLQDQVTEFEMAKGQEIEGKRAEIAALQQKLQQQELSLSADTRTSMAKNIQRQMLAFEASQEIATREIQLERAAAMSEFEEKLIACVDAFARDEGFDLILERAAVVWTNKAIDVTSAVSDRFDQMYPVSAE